MVMDVHVCDVVLVSLCVCRSCVWLVGVSGWFEGVVCVCRSCVVRVSFVCRSCVVRVCLVDLGSMFVVWFVILSVCLCFVFGERGSSLCVWCFLLW